MMMDSNYFNNQLIWGQPFYNTAHLFFSLFTTALPFFCENNTTCDKEHCGKWDLDFSLLWGKTSEKWYLFAMGSLFFYRSWVHMITMCFFIEAQCCHEVWQQTAVTWYLLNKSHCAKYAEYTTFFFKPKPLYWERFKKKVWLIWKWMVAMSKGCLTVSLHI